MAVEDGIYLVRREDGTLELADYRQFRCLSKDLCSNVEGWVFFGNDIVIPNAEFKCVVISGPMEPIDALKLHPDIRK